jgi:hypothetical protein
VLPSLRPEWFEISCEPRTAELLMSTDIAGL